MRAMDKMYTLISPRIVKRANGGYLAVSCLGSALMIGVEAKTEEEAKRRFADSLEQWQELHDIVEPCK